MTYVQRWGLCSAGSGYLRTTRPRAKGSDVAASHGKRTYIVRAALGIAAYAVLALAPVLLMLIAPPLERREFLREFSVALAFASAGILAMQLVLSSRTRELKAPYGIDAVYYFHRNMALVVLGLLALHPVLLFFVTPSRIALLNVFTAPEVARRGVLALTAIAATVGLSLWRANLNLKYEIWRHVHGVLALIILVLAWLHAGPAGIYTEGGKARVFLVYPVVALGFFAYSRVVRPVLQKRRPYRVASVERETPDAWRLEIRPDGHAGLDFRPGQFLWITIGRSPFSIVEHPFSFTSSPRRDGSFELTVKELGDFTNTIGSVKPGTVAYVEGPFGAFTTDRYPARSRVFLAGGIGIAPIISMLRAAAEEGDRTPMVLVYGAATREDLGFYDEIERLRQRIDLTVRYVLERPPDGWTGARGFINRQVMEGVVADPNGHEYFLCGPPAMIDNVAPVLLGMGVQKRRLHYERFAFV